MNENSFSFGAESISELINSKNKDRSESRKRQRINHIKKESDDKRKNTNLI